MINEEARRFLRLVYDQCVLSVNPKDLLNSELKVHNNKLLIRSNSYTLSNCYIVAFGKAVYQMACEVNNLLGNYIKRGIVSIPEGSLVSQNSKCLDEKVFKVFQGAKNNIPDINSLDAAQETLKMVKSLTDKDLLLVLISGGGSALLAHPVPPVTLEEKINVIKLLSHSGAAITELNTVRKQLSLIKGGRLAEAAYPCQVVSLILSDVINDPLDYIASGPTVINKDKEGSGLTILEKYFLINQVSPNVLSTLKVFKNEQDPAVFKNSHVFVIGSNSKALASGKVYLESQGKVCAVLTSQLEGNVENLADALCNLVIYTCQLLKHQISKTEFTEAVTSLSPVLRLSEHSLLNFMTSLSSSDELFLLFGGEPTVNVRGKGKGGRNTELALRFSQRINDEFEKLNLQDFEITLLSAGTDGIDGPTDAAGAVAYQGQVALAKQQGLEINDYLDNNDTYNFFKKFSGGKDLIITGHTGTNVMDIIILHILRKQN